MKRSLRIVVVSCALGGPCFAGAPQGRLMIDAQDLTAGRSDVPVPIKLDNEVNLFGFQLSLAVDTRFLRLDEIDLAGTVVQGAEFSDGEVAPDGSTMSWGVVLDISDPFDPNNFVPPGNGLTLARLIVDVVAPSATTTVIRFEDRPGPPSDVNLLFREGGIEVEPSTVDGVVRIVEPAGGFIRGDTNMDGMVNLTDGVNTLEFLFRSGAPLRCRDAADADDNGRIELTDAVYTFRALFVSGARRIPAPFPEPGLDPTPGDPLDCAEPR